MTQQEIIQDLIEKTDYCIKATQQFRLADDADLKKQASPDSWNALQCIEHLNRYGDFYLPEFRKPLQNAKKSVNNNFSSTFFGKKFCNLMLPKENNMVKMSSFKSKSPLSNECNRSCLDTFMDQQNELLYLLQQSYEVDLTKNKCSLTIPLIKMNLGDTLRFVIYHHVRHIDQAKRALG